MEAKDQVYLFFHAVAQQNPSTECGFCSILPLKAPGVVMDGLQETLSCCSWHILQSA
jgi:hypothetical protein